MSSTTISNSGCVGESSFCSDTSIMQQTSNNDQASPILNKSSNNLPSINSLTSHFASSNNNNNNNNTTSSNFFQMISPQMTSSVGQYQIVQGNFLQQGFLNLLQNIQQQQQQKMQPQMQTQQQPLFMSINNQPILPQFFNSTNSETIINSETSDPQLLKQRLAKLEKKNTSLMQKVAMCRQQSPNTKAGKEKKKQNLLINRSLKHY